MENLHSSPESITPISALIITYNEEASIARCIRSLEKVADEIIVIDSFSTDDTAKICHDLGVTFIEHRFEGHIQQKNFAITQANHDYCLSLDADEELNDEAIQSILSLKNNFSADGYTINRRNNYCGTWVKHSGWYPDRKLRLWHKKKGTWQGVNPHDSFKMDHGSSTGHIQGELKHYTVASLSAHVQQINYFTDIAAEELQKKGKRASLCDILLRPPFKFFRDYVLKLGFLDGLAGLMIAANSSHSVFLKYSKLYYLQRHEKAS